MRTFCFYSCYHFRVDSVLFILPIKSYTYKKISMKNVSVLFIIFTMCFGIVQAQAPYKVPELGYSYNALEPFIDAQTMEIHVTKHHAAYVNNLNNALKGTDAENMSLTDILKNTSKYSAAIRNNAGGHYNHSLFWTILTPNKGTKPSERLEKAIKESFVSVDSLKSLLNKAASTRFGSGWAWLYITPDNKLAVCSTPNQDNPLMDIADNKGIPILGIDVWEHAYYLKYQNKRGDYLNAIWNVMNWNEVSTRYENIVPKPKGKFDDWPELKSFHGVMSETFHPSETGDLKPIRARSGEMAEKAKALSLSKIPAAFNNKEVQAAVAKLKTDSDKLNKLVKKKGNDKAVTTALSALHDTFHMIVEHCH